MNLESLRRHAAKLAGATVDVKWGSAECCSVGGKMYAVFWIEAGRAKTLSFKVDADRFLELTDRPGVVPAPYLARAHWVQATERSAFCDADARALIERSHALVVGRLPRRTREAIDPSAGRPRPPTRPPAARRRKRP